MTNRKDSKIIITNDDVKTAGAVSYWRLSGRTSLGALRFAWIAAGLDPELLPKEVSSQLALSRAVRDQEGPTMRAFKIRGGEFDGGWGLATVDTTDGHVNVTEALRVRLDKDSDEIVFDKPEAVEADTIRRGRADHRATLASTDVSSWLVTLAEKHNAVSLRDSGGVYFIPRPAVDFWHKVATVVEGLSKSDHAILRIPALHNDEAIAAIVDAITAEAARAAAALDAALTEHNNAVADGDTGLGDRAFATQAKAALALHDKVTAYEDLLGCDLASVIGKIKIMSDKIADAAKARQENLDSVSGRLGAGVARAALSA